VRDLFRNFGRSHEAFLLIAVVLVGFILAVATPTFLSWRNLFNLIDSYAATGVFGAGLLLVLIAGGIDISFTATAAISQYLTASLLVARGGDWVSVFAVSAVVGAAIGTLTGLLVHTLRVSAIIVTIATLNMLYGVLIFVTNGAYIYDLPDWFTDGGSLVEIADTPDSTYSISIQAAVLAVVLAATAVILRHSSVGRQIYGLGGNAEAARRLGVNILRLHLLVYGYMGLLAGIAGVIEAQLAHSVAPAALIGTELDVLAVVLLGGASLAGGVGGVFGTILGLALLAELQNGLVLLGISSYWSRLLVGSVIIVSSGAAVLGRRAQAARARTDKVPARG